MAGLLLFSVITYHSFYVDSYNRQSHRDFFWGATRLDRDPLNQHFPPPAFVPCKTEPENRVEIDPESLWVEYGVLECALILSAPPVLGLGRGISKTIGHSGGSELTAFMISMPTLIFLWYYFVGWLLDRCVTKRKLRTSEGK